MSVRRVGKRWQVRVRIGAGARVEKTLQPDAKLADARQLEASIRRAQIDAAVGRRPQYLIDEALARWIDTGARQRKDWQRDLRYRLEVLRRYTADKPLDSLVDVADQVKDTGQRQGMNPATINRYVALLRRVGNLAESWGWTDKPLGRRVKLLPEHSERHVYLRPEEVEQLVAHADPLTADMIHFAVLTGLRQGEMLRLQPGQLRAALLLLDATTKNGRPRGIPLPRQAAVIARKRLPWGIGKSLLIKRFRAARSASKLEHVRWHDLRHTYASWLVQGGQPLTAVRDLLGHSSLAVTNRYAHLAPVHLRAAVRSLPRLAGESGVNLGKTQGRRKAA